MSFSECTCVVWASHPFLTPTSHAIPRLPPLLPQAARAGQLFGGGLLLRDGRLCALRCAYISTVWTPVYVSRMRCSFSPTIMVKNQVFIDLTEAGEKQRDRVQEAVFSYLALLRQRTNGGGIPGYVYEECKTLADIGWRFQVRRACVSVLSIYIQEGSHVPPIDQNHQPPPNRRRATPSPSPARSSIACRSFPRRSISRARRACST